MRMNKNKNGCSPEMMNNKKGHKGDKGQSKSSKKTKNSKGK